MKLIYKNLNLYGIMELICEFIRLILQSIKLIYHLTTSIYPSFFTSLGLVVMTEYSSVSFGNRSTKGRITFP